MMTPATAPHELVLAGPLLNDIKSKLGQVENVLLIALGVFAVWFVFKHFMQTRAIAAMITAFITVAVVMFGAANIDWLKTQLQGELKSAPAVTDNTTPQPAAVITAHHAGVPRHSADGEAGRSNSGWL